MLVEASISMMSSRVPRQLSQQQRYVALRGLVDAPRSGKFFPAGGALVQGENLAIAEVNPDAARKIVARLEKLKERLSAFPEMTEPGLLPGTRKIVLLPFVLTARVHRGIVEISSVRHARQRDVGPQLGHRSDLEDD
jgi:plasmid stabilization system protein ParE